MQLKFNPTSHKHLSWALLGLWLVLPLVTMAEGPKVVASIKPLHSLVAGVMQGVAEPLLLLPGGASPHDYSLKPSDVRALANARVVFWVGPELERFLVKALRNQGVHTQSVALLDAPGIRLLPLRAGGVWESHQHGPEGAAEQNAPHTHEQQTHETATATPENQSGTPHHAHQDASQDFHIWLDPLNAIAMVQRIATVLSETDPAHRLDYERNSAVLIERLNQLNQKLTEELAPVRNQPYIVFHDAYQYFERRYDLQAVGSITLDPERRPGARRIAEIQTRIRSDKVRCVFSEPQFQPALMETLITGSDAQRGILDPLGAELTAGPHAYFQLMQELSAALRTCLARS